MPDETKASTKLSAAIKSQYSSVFPLFTSWLASLWNNSEFLPPPKEEVMFSLRSDRLSVG